MNDQYHYLLGAEDAKNAGYAFQSAAEVIRLAVSEFAEHVRRLERVLEEHREPRVEHPPIPWVDLPCGCVLIGGRRDCRCVEHRDVKPGKEANRG